MGRRPENLLLEQRLKELVKQRTALRDNPPIWWSRSARNHDLKKIAAEIDKLLDQWQT